MKYTVIIPVGTETDISFYKKQHEFYKDKDHVDIIWVSQNEALNQWLSIQNAFIIKGQSKNRAQRINKGLLANKNDYVLLNHPRSILTEKALEQFESLIQRKGKHWGGFTHKFYDSDHPLLKFTSWYSNAVRFDLKGIIYLDHCIYFHKDLLRVALPEVDIFEDTLLSTLLNLNGPPIRLKGRSLTSAVRFLKNGVWQQALLNQKMKIDFFRRKSLNQMNKEYEKNLWLN